MFSILSLSSGFCFSLSGTNYYFNNKEREELRKSISTNINNSDSKYIYSHYLNKGEKFNSVRVYEIVKMKNKSLILNNGIFAERNEVIKSRILKKSYRYTNIDKLKLDSNTKVNLSVSFLRKKSDIIGAENYLKHNYSIDLSSFNFKRNRVMIEETNDISAIHCFGRSNNDKFYIERCSDNLDSLIRDIPDRSVSIPFCIGMGLGICALLVKSNR